MYTSETHVYLRRHVYTSGETYISCLYGSLGVYPSLFFVCLIRFNLGEISLSLPTHFLHYLSIPDSIAGCQCCSGVTPPVDFLYSSPASESPSKASIGRTAAGGHTLGSFQSLSQLFCLLPWLTTQTGGIIHWKYSIGGI